MTYEEVKEYWKSRSNIKLNDDKVNKILYAYKNGSTHKLAAQHAGITANTLKNWLKKGESCASQLEAGNDLDDPLDYAFVEFWQKVCLTQSNLQIQAFQQIQTAAEAPENWRAAVTILEKCFGKEYASNKTDIEIKNEASEPFSIHMNITNQDDSNDVGSA